MPTPHPGRLWLRSLGALGAAAVLAVVAAATLFNVSTKVTAEDVAYIEKILRQAGVSPIEPGAAADKEFLEQIRIVLDVQRAVQAAAPGNAPIPLDHGREPRDLFERGSGGDLDRSRTIEKALIHAGLATRHATVHPAERAGPFSQAGLAFSEVYTYYGWIAVDPDRAWIGFTGPSALTLELMSRDPNFRTTDRYPWVKGTVNPVLLNDFTVAYGFYSRHGRHFPPYGFLPDFNAGELLHNLNVQESGLVENLQVVLLLIVCMVFSRNVIREEGGARLINVGLTVVTLEAVIRELDLRGTTAPEWLTALINGPGNRPLMIGLGLGLIVYLILCRGYWYQAVRLLLRARTVAYVTVGAILILAEVSEWFLNRTPYEKLVEELMELGATLVLLVVAIVLPFRGRPHRPRGQDRLGAGAAARQRQCATRSD